MAQIDKNTVSAKGQLKPSQFVTFEQAENENIRILFVGNSITLHGVLEDIGWYKMHGMAASEKEKDYVHLVMKYIKKRYGSASFCISQVAEWERQYKNGTELLQLYKNARDFEADIIIMRLVENCPQDGFDHNLFKEKYTELLNYLNPKATRKVIITTSFWHHIADDAICEVAKENNIPLVELGDLGEDDAMKAVGLFEHSGVAAHPGDLGMKNIAERIIEELKNM